MIENPIQQPSFGLGGPVLSNEIIEGAAKLMGVTSKQTINESVPQQSNVHNDDLKQMIRDVVRDTVRDVVKEELQKAGMISEGQSTNESLQLRIGSHIFEGKVTKMKKIK
jgi:inhibitor of KinA sporulation pathway (predicted exonuclease)